MSPSVPQTRRLTTPILLFSTLPGDANLALSDVDARYLGYLYLATRATQESFIVDFAAKTLKLLGFNERRTTVSTRCVIHLTIRGEANLVAQTDVCLIHNPAFALLELVADKTPSNKTEAEVGVAAEAIQPFNSTTECAESMASISWM